MKNNTFLEKPIVNKSEDLFNISSYVEDLENAIDDGAKFIAIDGEYGSGKSSLVNILKNNEIKKDKKTAFVNINFLNINEENKNGNNETINNYHRYFVNQVANDICNNPFEIEQLFYQSFISYSVTNPSRYKLWKIIVDKLLLILTSYMIIFLTYKTFLQSIKELEFIFKYSDKINPVILITMFVLVIIYGYGIYKPNKQEKSPMLEIDKCRNIFFKIVSTKVKRHLSFKRKTKLFLIIDDLDRIDENLQVKIISLLYNEYYPLKINGIELIFVFMINAHKLQDKLLDNKVSNEKLFDYILPVSNNQKHIIRHLTNKMINEHDILNEIFNNKDIKNREYIIGLICKKYETMRKIKHFFNKLISKYNYIRNKNIDNINYDEMIIISIMLDQVETSVLDSCISKVINNETLDDDSENIKDILEICKGKKIFDADYYIYLYNFIDKDDILNHYENELYLISEKGYENITPDDENKILDYFESEKVRYDKVFYEIFLFLENDTKIIFATSKKFCDYLIKSSNFFGNIDITNAYKNWCGYCLCDNIPLDINIKNAMIYDLKEARRLYLESKTSENAKKLKSEFKEFLEKMWDRIFKFDLKNYFSIIEIDDDIYKLLFEPIIPVNIENGFKLLNDEIIDCNYIKKYINNSFLTKVNSLPSEMSISIKNQILNTNDIDVDVIVNIIGDESIKFENIEFIYDKINSSNKYINYEKLIIILNQYGYSEKLDKHISYHIDKNESNMIRYLNSNRYSLSSIVLEKLDSISTVYKFTNYYEEIFVAKEFYSLYIYSRLLKNQHFDINKNMISNDKYKNNVLDIYKNINNWALQYSFTKNYSEFILENFDFNSIKFTSDNFWKITHHISNIASPSQFTPILVSLKSQNQLENFFNYCINRSKSIDIEFIKFLRSYAQEMGLSSSIKAKLTKKINKSKISP